MSYKRPMDSKNPHPRPRGHPRSFRFGKKLFNEIIPDRAEIKIGGPPPLPQGKVEWDREKKERISQLRKRINA